MAEITVDVLPPNQLPQVSIASPTDGATFSSVQPVAFNGSAVDAEDGDISAGIEWTSDLDGALGVGGSISRLLSVGTHTITAAVTDSRSGTGTAFIMLDIHQGTNTLPVVNISSPASGSTFTDADSITFTAGASDAEDGDLTNTISWASDLDGSLGSGGSVTATLSIGTHTISAAVTDSSGDSSTATVTLTVDQCRGGPKKCGG